MMAMAFASISQAAEVPLPADMDVWTFNVANGPVGNAPSSSEFPSGGGAAWITHDNVLVDNQQMLFDRNNLITTGKGNYFKNVTPSVGGVSGATTGEFECQWDFASVDFGLTAAANQKATVALGFRGAGNADAMLRLQYEGQLNITNVTVTGATNIYTDADNILLMVKDGDFNWAEAHAFPAGSTISDLKIRINYNLFNGTVDFYYNHAGAGEVLLHAGNLPADWAISTYRCIAQFANGGSIWEQGDTVRVDNLVYSMIQEPFNPPAFAVLDAWHHAGLTNGATMAQSLSTGHVGGAFFSNADLASITNEMLMFKRTSTAASQDSIFRATPPSLYAGSVTGVYELSFRLRFDQTKFVLQYTAGNDSNKNIATFDEGVSVLSNLNVRMLMDLNNDTAQLFYTLNGGAEIAGSYNLPLLPNFALSEYRLVVQTINGNNSWQVGDSVLTDNLVFEKVEALVAVPAYTNVAEYLMNDSAGTLLEGIANTGDVDPNSFEGTDSFITTDGFGLLVWSDVTNVTYNSHTLAATYTEGFHQLDISLEDWSLVTGTNGCGVKIGLFDDTGTNGVQIGIDSVTNVASARIRANATSSGGGQVFTGNTTGTGVVLRVEINLAAGVYNAWWSHDNLIDFQSVVTGGTIGNMANIKNIRVATVGENWDVSDYVKVSDITYNTTSTEGPTGVSPAEQAYIDWVAGYPGFVDTDPNSNPDGDEFDNLLEYSFGGDPTVVDAVNAPAFGETTLDGGTNYILYVYAERNDAGARGLIYTLETNPDLVSGTWTNDNYEVVGTDTSDPEFNMVTNRVSTDAANEQFIQLQVEFQP
jgi:hypothetical protein